MRYVAKLHVLDVMDQVVVSGYVHEQDAQGEWSPEVTEFSYSWPGRGIDDQVAWLAVALGQAALRMTRPPAGKAAGGRAEGAPYTLYETGDTGQ